MDSEIKVRGAIPPERMELLLSTHQKNNFARLLNIRLRVLDEGYSRLEMAAVEHCINPYGMVHGGATATLADIAMSAAIRTLGLQPVTVELTVNYLEPAGDNETLVAEGRVLHQGRTLILTECRVCTQDGRVVARGKGLFTTRPG